MSIPVEPSLFQNEVLLNAKQRKSLIRSGSDNVLWLDINRSVSSLPIISLQTMEVWLCQWPSLTGMEHYLRHTRAVHEATS